MKKYIKIILFILISLLLTCLIYYSSVLQIGLSATKENSIYLNKYRSQSYNLELDLSNGKIILKHDENNKGSYKNLFYYDRSGNEYQITSNNTYIMNLSISPDEKNISYEISEGKIVVFREDSKKTIVYGASFGRITNLNWSPDSKFISFIFHIGNKTGGAIIQLENNEVIFYQTIEKADTDFGLNYRGIFSPILWTNRSDEVVYINDGNLIIYDLKTKKEIQIDEKVFSMYLGHRGETYYDMFYVKQNRFVIYERNYNNAELLSIVQSDYKVIYDTTLGIKTYIPIIK